MYKFMMLIKNEIIKLALKSGTQILNILLIAISAGACIISTFDAHNYASWYRDDDNEWIQWHQDEIDELKRIKEKGWEERVEYLQFLIDNQISRSDWRHGYVNSIYNDYGYYDSNIPDVVSILDKDEALELLAADDWKGLYQLIIDTQKLLPLLGASEEQIDIINWKYTYCLEKDISPADEGWKNAEITRLAENKEQIYMLESVGTSDSEEIKALTKLKDEAAISQYRLDNNIARIVSYKGMMENMIGGIYDDSDESVIDVWVVMDACVRMVPFMSVFIIIIAGGLVSSEFSNGTIKFLLMTPVKRWKILAAKYLVMLLTGMLFLAVMFSIYFFLGSGITMFKNMNAVNLTAANEVVTSIPAFIYYGQLYLLGTVNIVVIATLAFSLSSLTRNSGLATAISIAVLIGGEIINLILTSSGVDWGRYLLFANANLVKIIYENDPFMMYKGHTLTFAVVVIAVHMVIFIMTAWDGFTKKEI